MAKMYERAGDFNPNLARRVAKAKVVSMGLRYRFIDREPLDLPADSKALHLIGALVRDEVQNCFAITAHRKNAINAASSGRSHPLLGRPTPPKVASIILAVAAAAWRIHWGKTTALAMATPFIKCCMVDIKF